MKALEKQHSGCFPLHETFCMDQDLGKKNSHLLKGHRSFPPDFKT